MVLSGLIEFPAVSHQSRFGCQNAVSVAKGTLFDSPRLQFVSRLLAVGYGVDLLSAQSVPSKRPFSAFKNRVFRLQSTGRGISSRRLVQALSAVMSATTFCTLVREFSPSGLCERVSVSGVPDEYPMKPVFDGARWSRRVKSGHSKPAQFSQNPQFWVTIVDS